MTTPSGADPQPDALFDADLDAWHRQPERAFDGWLASHGFRHGTAVVYRAMWGKLLRWSGEQGLPPLTWSAGQIGAFLDAQDLHKRHRYRYARLIERVFHHLSLLQQNLHNPASQAVKRCWACAIWSPAGGCTPPMRLGRHVPACPRPRIRRLSRLDDGAVMQP